MAEARAHRKSRKKQGKRVRTCLVGAKHLLLCRQGWQPEEEEEEEEQQQQQALPTIAEAPTTAPPMQQPGCVEVAGARDVVASFQWNNENMQSFRLELEKVRLSAKAQAAAGWLTVPSLGASSSASTICSATPTAGSTTSCCARTSTRPQARAVWP